MSSAHENGRNYRPKHVELTEVINKLSLLYLVGSLYHGKRSILLHYTGSSKKDGGDLKPL